MNSNIETITVDGKIYMLCSDVRELLSDIHTTVWEAEEGEELKQ